MARRISALASLSLLLVLAGPGLCRVAGAEEEKPKFEVVDPDGLYFGDKTYPKTPAVIAAASVWAEIPEYKKIVEEELGEDDPKYHLLMKKATERFSKALRKAAKRGSHDVIGETGSIEAKDAEQDKIPDITDDLIELVGRN